MNTLEEFARQLYTETNPELRTQLEEQYKEFVSRYESIELGLRLLTESENHQAQFFASSALKTLITDYWNVIGSETKNQIQNTVLEIRFGKQTRREANHVLNAMETVVARSVKLGWDDPELDCKNLLDKIAGYFFSFNPEIVVASLRVSRQLVEEFTMEIGNRETKTVHRKKATSFQEYLIKFLDFAVSVLGQSPNEDEALETLRKISEITLGNRIRDRDQAMRAVGEEQMRVANKPSGISGKDVSRELFRLVRACLNFGLPQAHVEQKHGTTAIYFRSEFRELINKTDILSVFFDHYQNNTIAAGAVALECVGLFVQIPSYYFSTDGGYEKMKNSLVKGIWDILKDSRGLDNEDIAHQFCVMHFNTAGEHDVREFTGIGLFDEWMDRLLEFTLHVLRRSTESKLFANSIYYLLGFWGRVSGVRAFVENHHNQFAHKNSVIFQTYIRLQISCIDWEFDTHEGVVADALDEGSGFYEILQAICELGRINYEGNASFLISQKSEIEKKYHARLANLSQQDPARDALATDLAFLVAVTTILIRKQARYPHINTKFRTDAELVECVLSLLANQHELGQSHENPPLSQPLHNACLFFLHSIWKTHLSTTSSFYSSFFDALSSISQIDSNTQFHAFILNALVWNLKHWASSLEIISKSLDFLLEIVANPYNFPAISHLDPLGLLESEFTSFVFLESHLARTGKLRRVFFAVIGKLIFMEENRAKRVEHFDSFSNSLDDKFKVIHSSLQESSPQQLAELFALEDNALPLFAFMQDLRGFLSSATSPHAYTLFFEWFFPDHFNDLLALSSHLPLSSRPLLHIYKFWAELTYNQAQRIMFDSTSPYGMILFSAASDIIQRHSAALISNMKTLISSNIQNVENIQNIQNNLQLHSFSNFNIKQSHMEMNQFQMKLYEAVNLINKLEKEKITLFQEKENSDSKRKKLEILLKKAEEKLRKFEMRSQSMDEQLNLMENYNEIENSEIEFKEEVGRGTFGKVFRAIWRGKEVAVKLIFPEYNTGMYLTEFQREVFMLSKTRHPNIVLFMGACTKPPNIFIVTEFMSEGSLYHVIKKDNFKGSQEMWLKIARDIALGVNYLHLAKPKMIIHRDLKSLNVLLDENYNSKIADFGMSRIKEESAKLTKLKGSPCWMAPEIFRNEVYNEKADIYSYGIVLWELITKEFPYKGIDNPIQLGFKVAYQKLRPDISKITDPKWKDLITQCWADEPDDRPSFDKILEILNTFEKK
eukprot:Anaeramoba_ignava/a91349_73.p1 GENE.a91349_73~~a91349_73.p1  ORF type:complete len:1246 (-),score=329.81 a91349_73:137-3838(-)